MLINNTIFNGNNFLIKNTAGALVKLSLVVLFISTPTIRFTFNMKLIKLNGINCLYAIVDDEDFEKLNKKTWYLNFSHDKCYASAYSHKIKRKSFNVRMHRVIMGVTDPQIKIDHIDHNGLNNQKSNLRSCSNAENIRNRKGKNSNSNSLYLGVSRKKSTFILKIGRVSDKIYFEAHIYVNNKKKHLGYFDTEELAALARDKASIKYFGEFAYLNFPDKI